MFTGIVSDIGKVEKFQRVGSVWQLVLKTDYNTSEIKLGSSICCNGACLTVTKTENNLLYFDLSPETIDKTNFSYVSEGDEINLERSLKVGDELGGHFVTGHVDEIAKIAEIDKDDENWVVKVKCPHKFRQYIAPKGSVTLNGVSLTVNDVADDIFLLNIIPHTLKHTNLKNIVKGSKLNMEIDILARYIERIKHTE